MVGAGIPFRPSAPPFHAPSSDKKSACISRPFPPEAALQPISDEQGEKLKGILLISVRKERTCRFSMGLA